MRLNLRNDAVNKLELKIPPLLLVVIFALLMWLLSGAVDSAPGAVAEMVALGIVGLAFLVSLAGVVEFRRRRTTTNPMKPEAVSQVVSSGIYRFSRNPMYLGFLLALVGWALWLSNPLAWLLLPMFVLYMNRFQIVPEERVLTEIFGDEYRQYMVRVRRWI